LNDTISNVHVVLQNAGFRTREATGAQVPAIAFEDETTLGFVYVFATPKALIEHWRSAEAGLLSKYAANFRIAGDKAWNVYSVFIAEQRGTDQQCRAVRWIEEDLEKTRKITATGVGARDDVVTALLPLLPIVSKPVLIPEDSAVRLQRRIDAIAPEISAIALDDDVPASDVAAILRDQR
jgi:hypothetical protein